MVIEKLDFNNLPTENERIEYKSCFNKLSKDVWETVSSFQNTVGGYLILGIKEKDSSGDTINEVRGIKDPQKIIDQFWTNINELISYNELNNEDITTLKLKNGNYLIEIHILPAKDSKIPVLYKGYPYLRKGSADIKAKGEDYIKLITNSSEDLDTEVLPNYWIDDLDLNTVNEYRRILTDRNSYSFYRDLDLEVFLERIGVIVKDYKGKGKKGITTGGLLFFGKNNAIIQTFPNFQLEFFDQTSTVDRWSNRVSSVLQDLNIFSFYQAAKVSLFRTIENQFELDKNMVRKDTSETMRVALREALLNMLMHANYKEGGTVEAYAKFNYYEFNNPGKMLIPVDDFFTNNNSKSRNPVISKLFVQLGLGERAGHGGEKIMESALENRYRLPEISTDEDKTQLKIWKVDYADSFSNQKINDRERKVLKAILSTSALALSHKDIEKVTGMSRSIVTSILNSLMDKDLVNRIGNARSTKYTIKMTTTQLLAQVEAMPNMLRELFKNISKNE